MTQLNSNSKTPELFNVVCTYFYGTMEFPETFDEFVEADSKEDAEKEAERLRKLTSEIVSVERLHSH